MLHRYCALLFIACLVAWAQALARDTGTDPAVVVDRYIQHYVVEPDGSYRLSIDHAETIVQQRALRTHGQYAISYNRTLDELLSLEAYTQKPDGRRVIVQPGQVQDQQEAASGAGEAPMFQDTRLKVVVFPEAAVGDQLVVRYVLRRKAALFPGHFEDLTFSPFYLNKNLLLIYDMPAAMLLRADAVGFVAVRGESPPGRRRYQWRYVNGDNERLEAGSVSYLDYGKRLAVSTFPDYAAFARAFRVGAAGVARPSPATQLPTQLPIIALARQLTAGLPDTRARALALSDWVRHNIRYAGVYVGPGGVVPHPPATVLANRYGDCKDHAGLLEALLAAIGIDSTSALVNSGNAYRLPGVPTLGVFNHMITYVPGLDLYLDPTAETVSAGYLSSSLLGKPVLLLKTGTFAMTPILQPERNRTTTWFDIRRDGRSSFRLSKTASGAIAEPYRTALRDSRQAERDAFVQRMLQGLGQKSRGVFDGSPGGGTGDEVRIAFSGTSDGFLDLPGPSALATTYDLWGGLAEAVAGLGGESERRQEFVCPAIDQEDETGFRLPEGVRILALPKPVNLMDGGIYYRASYTRRGNEVKVRRRLTFRHGRATCTPADFRAMQPALDRIVRDLRSQIVVSGG
jgi:hypothetical protein